MGIPHWLSLLVLDDRVKNGVAVPRPSRPNN